MKTAIKNGLVLVSLLLIATVSYGNTISSNINNGKILRTNELFKNVKKGSKLSVKDKYGFVLYSEIVKEVGKDVKGFDLTSLPDGDYYLEINKEVEITVIPFKVYATIVTFDKGASNIILKPVVLVNKKNVNISKKSIEDEVLQILIFSKNSKLVYSGSIVRKSDVLEKVFDFSNFLRGNYTVVIITKDRTFFEKIKI